MGLSIDEQRKDFRETFRKADNRPHFFGGRCDRYRGTQDLNLILRQHPHRPCVPSPHMRHRDTCTRVRM